MVFEMPMFAILKGSWVKFISSKFYFHGKQGIAKQALIASDFLFEFFKNWTEKLCIISICKTIEKYTFWIEILFKNIC